MGSGTGWLIVALALGLGACGTAARVIPIQAPGRADTLVTLDAASDVHFWVNVHPADSDVQATYEIELVQDGRKVADAHCSEVVSEHNPTCALQEVSYGDRHLTCSLKCSARVPRTGPT